MNKGLNTLFPTPVWLAERADDGLSRCLAEAIHDIEAGDHAFDSAAYPHGYSSYLSRIPLTRDTRFQSITEWVLDQAKQFLLQAGVRKSPTLRLQVHDLFCNINRRHAIHGPHRHECSDLSAVYYVTANPSSAPFVMTSPLEPLHMYTRAALYHEDSLMLNDQHAVQPSSGRLLIFPSWLLHEVQPQRCDEERISLAFNLGLVEEADRP